MKNLFKNLAWVFLVFLVLAVIFSFFAREDEPKRVGIEKLIQVIKEEKVESLIVQGDTVLVNLKDQEELEVKKEAGESLTSLLSNFEVDPELLSGVSITIEEKPAWEIWLMSLLPFLIPLLIIIAFFFFAMRGLQGANSRAMNFGQSNAKDFNINLNNKVSFRDVAGAKEAKEELQEVVDFLRFPKKFKDLGAKIPRGVLLLGSPGTGKTLLARAVAGEAKVPFFHMSGSEFVEMFVGVGASRVRSLFQKAKKTSPCIIFIDEIDAVGRRRGAGLGGSHDEREQTLNQILVEMDGFEPNQNVIVIAATNRPDVLDPALLRPGRFDRQITIDRPDINDREKILKVHAKKKPIEKDISLRTIAERTPGFSGADLANLLNEAAILAARNNRRQIIIEDLFEAIEKVMIGPERRSRVISDREKKITAYHEAGHAIVAHFLPNTDPVQKISIIARGQAGGYTLKVPTEDKRLHSRSEFLDELAVLLAGHLVEKKVFGEVTTGATSDLRRATAIARSLITDYGMSNELGPRTFGEKDDLIFLGKEIHEQRDYSEKVAEKIDEEITRFLKDASEKVNQILQNHNDKLEAVVDALLKKETLEKDQFVKIVGEKPNNKEKENNK